MKHAFHEGWTVRNIFASARVIGIDTEMERIRNLRGLHHPSLVNPVEDGPSGRHQSSVSVLIRIKLCTASRYIRSDSFTRFES